MGIIRIILALVLALIGTIILIPALVLLCLAIFLRYSLPSKASESFDRALFSILLT